MPFFMRKPIRLKRIFHLRPVTGLWAVLILAFSLTSCSLPDGGRPTATSGYDSFQVQKSVVPAALELTGNIEFQQSTDLNWETNGVVESVNAVEGQTVKKGDILATLETASLSSEVLTAENSLIEAEDALDLAQSSDLLKAKAFATLTANQISLQATKQAQEILYFPRGDKNDKEQAYDSFRLAQQNFEYAKEDYRVVTDSYKGWDDAARTTYFDSYQTAFEALKTSYEKWKWVSGAPNDVALAAAEGAVLSAQKDFDAALEEYSKPKEDEITKMNVKVKDAEQLYEKRFLIAPFDGVVSGVFAETGDSIKEKQLAFHLDNPDHVFVKLEIIELDIAKVKVGDAVTIVLDADSDKSYNGKVTGLSETGIEKNNSFFFTCTVEIENPDASIRSGMTAKVQLGSDREREILLIPTSAVAHSEEGDYVFRIDDGQPVKVNVELGTSFTDMIEVRSGLHEGQIIIKTVSELEE